MSLPALAPSQELVDERIGAIQTLVELERIGAATEVALDLSQAEDVTYEKWEALGRFFGSLERRLRWYIGDWINHGEALFGEEAAQAVESTVAERYDVAERTTGLSHQTLLNYASVCSRVARERRRHELSFAVHDAVARLDPEEQTQWLDLALENGWSASQLRAEIRGEGETTELGSLEPPEGGDGLSTGERLDLAARRVYHAAQRTSDGDYRVPPEPFAQLASALGEE